MSLETNQRPVTASVPGESNQGIERRNSFPRSARLLRHTDFERVYKLGRRHFSASMTVFYWQREAGDGKTRITPGLRIGFTVGRALGGAVQRNRIKRRLREAVRLNRPWPAANADVVINPKKSVLTADFAAVEKEVHLAFVAIEQKLAVRSRGEQKVENEVSASRKPETGNR